MNMFPQHLIIVKAFKKTNVFSKFNSIKRIIELSIVVVTNNNNKINQFKIAS